MGGLLNVQLVDRLAGLGFNDRNLHHRAVITESRHQIGQGADGRHRISEKAGNFAVFGHDDGLQGVVSGIRDQLDDLEGNVIFLQCEDVAGVLESVELFFGSEIHDDFDPMEVENVGLWYWLLGQRDHALFGCDFSRNAEFLQHFHGFGRLRLGGVNVLRFMAFSLDNVNGDFLVHLDVPCKRVIDELNITRISEDVQHICDRGISFNQLPNHRKDSTKSFSTWQHLFQQYFPGCTLV